MNELKLNLDINPAGVAGKIVPPRFEEDMSGLLHAFLFEPNGSGEYVDLAAIVNWLKPAQERTSDRFAWMHFSLSNSGSIRWMRANLDLPDSFYSSLHEGIGSTRLEQEGSALVAVIHDVLFDFSYDPLEVSTVVLFIGPHFMVSVRLKPLRSLDNLREAVKAGTLFQSPVDLLSQLLRNQAGGLVDIVRKTTKKVDEIEDNLIMEKALAHRRDLGLLRRILVRLQRLLAPEPAALFRLLNRPPDWIRSEDLQALRESAEEFSTAVADSSSLTERIKLLQEEQSARVNEATNRTLFTLTIVTVLALPINMVAGLFGMNVGGIPLAHQPHGFAAVVVVIALFTGLLAFLVFRKKS